MKRSEGAVSPFVLVALLALLAASALALDAGVLWTARTQLQGTVDASALAAAASLIDPAGPAVTADAAVDAAAALARANAAVPAPSVELADVRIGHWDSQARTFDTGVDLGDPGLVNAVDVRARLDGTSNRAVPAFMARVLGRESFTVSASATAWLGFAGSAEPGGADLPIAIDCCSLQGPACANDYCDTTFDPPSPCEEFPVLDPDWGLPQDHDDPIANPLSCLDLNSTPVQNACWTNFEPPGTRTNTNELREMVASGNPIEVEVGDNIELDQGEKKPVFDEIVDRFNAEGSDRYPPAGGPDSWVVRLPVVSCQQGSPSCNQGEITGFVCFELRQIEVVPGKILRGRFLCRERDAELFEDCALSGSVGGGDDFNIHAEIPVLVR